MTTEYIALSGEMTAAEALEALRQKHEKSDLLDIYVTDEHNHLTGILPLRSLVFASGQTRVKDLMVPDPVTYWAMSAKNLSSTIQQPSNRPEPVQSMSAKA